MNSQVVSMARRYGSSLVGTALVAAGLVYVAPLANGRMEAQGAPPQHDAHAAHHGGPGATAQMKDAQGKTLGDVTLRQTSAGVLVRVDLRDLPPGVHAFHIHSTGRCDPPTFSSAGDHFAPGGTKHGILSPSEGEGAAMAHAGDLPNVHVPSDGRLSLELLAPHVTLSQGDRSVLDRDGSALVLHERADDYLTDPAGNAGDRIACGVITAGQ